MTAFGAVCAALFRRERTGEGEHIDIALFDALFGSNDAGLQSALLDDDFKIWYHPVHATKDGYVTANIGPDFRAWQNVCAAMDRADLLADPRFDSAIAVRENTHAASAIVGQWLATMSASEAERILTAHHVACGIVMTADQAVRQPQVAARNLVVEVDDPVLGRVPQINSAFKYRASDSGVSGPAPMLGEHNRTVLKERLNFSDEQVDALEHAGVLKSGDT